MPSSGGDLILMVPVHVDDGLAVTNSLPLYNWFIAELSKELEVIDLGPVSMFSRYFRPLPHAWDGPT